jgi:hypothetical protein
MGGISRWGGRRIDVMGYLSSVAEETVQEGAPALLFL